MLQSRLLRGAMLAALLTASMTVQAAVGYVVFVTGQATVERPGNPAQPLTPFTTLENGDVLNTGPDGSLQFRMENGEEYTLQASTLFVIDEYTPPKAASAPGTGRSFYRLLAGGFRGVTRSVTSRGFESYRVETPVATMGIRGTIYNARLEHGLYVQVEQGSVMLQNHAGSLEVLARQVGFVSGPEAVPTIVSSGPSLLSRGGGGGAGSAGAAGALSATSVGVGLGVLGVAAALAGGDEDGTTTTTTSSTQP